MDFQFCKVFLNDFLLLNNSAFNRIFQGGFPSKLLGEGMLQIQ